MDWMVAKEKRDCLVSLDPEAEREYLDLQVQWVRKEILAEMVTLGCLANLDRRGIQVHLV